MWKIGFLHRFSHAESQRIRSSVVTPIKEVTYVTPDFDKLQTVYRASITPDKVEELAQQLGVSAWSLNELDIGWSNIHQVYTFPMRGIQCQIIGIQTRDKEGHKRVVRGGSVGVFISHQARTCVTFITEGASDTASALTIGLHTVGRFNCVTGADLLASLLSDQVVFIISDTGGGEIQGAVSLCHELRASTKYAGTIFLPFDVKDLRMAVNTYGVINTLTLIWKQVYEQIGERYAHPV
jgi:hypothetical protein